MVPSAGTRSSGHKLKEMPFQHKNSFFFFLTLQVIKQVFETGCGVSIPGDIKNPTEYSPKQPPVASAIFCVLLHVVLPVFLSFIP